MKIFTKYLIILAVLVMGVNAFAANVEIGGSGYSTLKAAFDAINAGTHTGSITITINANLSETTTANLNASGNGNASYSSVVIYPTGTYKISGNNTNGIIQLSGADYVTIDGRANQSGTTRSLTIENTATSGPIVRIDSLVTSSDPANNNIIQYCDFKHNSMTSSAYGITFGASNNYTGVGTHQNNQVQYCKFTKMYYGIRVYGTSGYEPRNTKINNNIFGSSTLTESVSYQALYIYYTDGTQVYDNVFEYLTHTSTLYAMYMYYAKNSKVNNNIIRNVNHVSGLYGFYIYYSPNSEVKGNTFQNFTTGAGQCYPIYISHSSQTTYDVSNNYFDNVGGTSTFYAIYMSNGNYSKVNNNTIKNVFNSSTIYGIQLSSCPYAEVKNNTLDNLVGTSTSSAYGLYLSSCNNSDISNNKITNFKNGAYVYGIYLSSCATSKVNNNLLDNYESNGASATASIGFYASSCSSSEFVNNSVSRMISTQYSSGGTTTNPFGFVFTSGNYYKIYYNSVNLTGKQLEIGTQGTLSACIMFTSTSVNYIDMRNNNLYNDLVGAANSNSYCVYMPSTSNLTGSTMDYNNYYVGGTYGKVGYIGGIRNTLADWKAGTSREANSNNIFTNFNSPSVLAPYIGSALLGKGIPISGYQTDIIGVTRSASTPTPGAYELADDIVGPDIVFQKLLITTSTSNRTLVATITDKTGLNTTSSAPRLYYRKSSSENTYYGNTSSTAGWKYSDGSQNGNQFTFVVDYSKLQGGAAVNDRIEYFIVARDVASKQNMTSTSGIFQSYPTTTNLASNNFPVVNTDSYTIAMGMSGTYSVGTNQTYTTLTKASGIFKALSAAVLEGNVVIEVVSNLAEDGEFGLTKLSYDANGPYSVTIRPSSTTKRTINGQVSGTLIKIIGANNVTIDGSYGGDNGRYLKFENTADNSVATYRATIMAGSGGGVGGNNITIKNCEITSGSRLNYSFGIITSDGTISTSASTNNMNNLLIKNNQIYNCTYGMYVAGGSSYPSTTMNNLIIEDNIVGHETKSTSILSYGIEVRYAPGGQIRRNEIFNFDGGPNNTNYIIGIQVYTTGSLPTVIDGNKIYGLNYQGTSVCFANGIYVSGSYAQIQNNMISEILTTGYSYLYSSSYMAAGIRLAGSYTRVWHNTIHMTGEMKYYSSSIDNGGFAANIYVTSSYTSNDFRGNILHNSVYKATNSYSHPEAFNIYFYTTANIASYFTQLDNNVYSIGNTAKVGGNGTTYPHTYVLYNLAQWKSYTGRDVNSKEAQPQYIDNNKNLHLNGSSIGNSTFMYGGMPEITNDADGETRNAATYYGADELNANIVLNKDMSVAPSNPVHCIGDASTVAFEPTIQFGDKITRSGLSAIDIQWFKDGQLLPKEKGNNITFNPVKMVDSARYYTITTFMGKSKASQEVLLKVEEPMGFASHPPTSDVCVSAPDLTLQVEESGTVLGFQWEFRKAGTSTWQNVYGATSNKLYQTINNNLVGEYRVKMMGPGNCGPATIYSDESTVTISTPLKNVNLHQIDKSAERNLNYTCLDEDISLNVTDEGTVFGYRWQRDVGAGFVDLPVDQYLDAHSATLRIVGANPGHTGTYRVKVLGSAACGTAEVYSQEVRVKVWPYFSLDEQPESQTLCEGENSFIRVNISGIVYSYQWFKDGIKLTANESEYYNRPVFYFNDAKFEDGGVYSCQVQAEDCFGYIDFMSQEASIYVATGTEITIPPMTQAVVPGGKVEFIVRAHVNGTPEGYVPEVQWYRGSTPLVDGGRFIGTKSDHLSIVNVQEADFGENYRVVVKGHCGSDEASAFGLLKGVVEILEQPRSADVCEDEALTFTVRAQSSIPESYLNYQWYRDGIALVDADGISGTKSNTLMIAAAKVQFEGNYNCVVKEGSAIIGLSTVEATLTVSPKPVILVQPDETVTVATGAVLALSVDVQGFELAYQWYFEGEAIENEDTNTLLIYDVTESNAGKYWVVISNKCGEVTSIVSDVTITTTTTDVADVTMHGFTLGSAVPNPINGSSNMSFTVPTESQVRIVLVNAIGAEIAVLSDELVVEGTHSLVINAQKLNLTSGVYSVVLKSSGVMLTQRIIVVK